MKIITITLPEANERREKFDANFPAILGGFEYYYGKGKNDVAPPHWWLSKKTHWALVENYIDIFEKYGNDDLLIFEDDCNFVNDFAKRYQPFIDLIPDVADLIYLGVINNMPPVRMNDGIVKVVRGLSSHAIIYKKHMIPFLLRCLKAPHWQCYHGYDERLAFLEHQCLLTAYAPVVPLCGQQAGYSYIMEKDRPAFLEMV